VSDWIQIEDAWSHIEREVGALAQEDVDLHAARGRVLATVVRADRDFPPFDRAAMDGFAVRSVDVRAASSHAPIELDIVGEATPGNAYLGSGDAPGAVRIMTGAPLPAGWDRVVPVESTSGFDGPTVRVFAALHPGANVSRRGIERTAGDTLYEPGHRVRDVDVGILAMAGVSRVRVVRRPHVAVLSTGDELVAYDQQPGPTQIRNSNAPMLAAMAGTEGEVHLLGRVADTRAATAEAVSRGLRHDVLLITGGISMGAYDWVGTALEAARVEVHFRRVALQPGKPVLFGTHPAGVVLALPGNPVSAYTTVRLFALPVLRRLQGMRRTRPLWVRAAARFAWRRRGPKCILLPGRIADAGAAVERVPYTGSGDLMAYARADCQIVLPCTQESVQPGDPVWVWPLDPAFSPGLESAR